MRQCENLCIPFVESPEEGLKGADLIVDAIFGMIRVKSNRFLKFSKRKSLIFMYIDFPGFSFSGEVREPFVSAIDALRKTILPIVSGTVTIKSKAR